MKELLRLLLVCTIFFGLSFCGKSNACKDVDGSWVSYGREGGLIANRTSLDFNRGGSSGLEVWSSMSEFPQKGTFSLSGDQITMNTGGRDFYATINRGADGCIESITWAGAKYSKGK